MEQVLKKRKTYEGVTYKKRARRTLKQKRKDRAWFTMCLPAMLHLVLFHYVTYIGIVIAFQFYVPRYGFLYSDFVGFDNFMYLFKSITFTRIVTNAIIFNVLNLVFGTFIGVFLGIFIFEVSNKIFVKMAQTIMFFPYFIAWPVAGTLFASIISDRGVLTHLIMSITGKQIYFYEMPQLWYFIITFARIWKGCGVSAVIYYATLLNVDSSLYEAAAIDGAGRFRRMWHVSVPCLKPMVIIGIIMNSANILKSDFGLMYFLPQNSPVLYPVTDVIETYMFRALRVNGDYSISAATGLVQGVVGLILTLFVNKIVKVVQKDLSLY